MDRKSLLLLAAGFEGGLALLGGALGGWFGVDVWPSWPPGFWPVLAGLACTVPGLAALAVILRSGRAPLVRLRETTEDLFEQLFARATTLDLALVSLMAGLGEEILFRGFLQTWLAGHLGLVPAVLAAGVAFGLAHFISRTYAVYATLMGLYLGVLLPATGSLWAPILAHAAYDFAALLVFQRRRRSL